MPENAVANETSLFLAILPYIVTVVSACISGFASYWASRRQAKADLQKLEKQHELDIQRERELFAMEKEKLELTHKHQLELKQKELEGQIGTDVVGTMFKEYMRTPAGKAMLQNSANNGRKRRG